MKAKTGFKYAGFGVLGVAAIFAFTWVVMLLWNALIPELFKGPELAYWQTMGLLVLSKIIFSGIGGGSKGEKSSHVRKQRCREDYPKSRWRKKYEAKMNGKVEAEGKESEDA
jgi:H+/Cl- antiporter ClcA